MVLIAEAGSTKCDWTIIKGTDENQTSTMGFNPFFHSEKEIVEGIKQNSELIDLASIVTQVFYLGAGCSSERNRTKVHNALSYIFESAKIQVDHDLTGAAYATYQGEPAITAILGTGSNACYFDGKNVFQEIPSLGFILGDEGSGGYFGKKLITAYCYKQLPNSLTLEFEQTFPYRASELIHRVNSVPHANVFLAEFMPFISKHKENEFIRKMLIEGMTHFLKTHVLVFENAQNMPIHFIGSVAYYFQDYIREAAKNLSLSTGVFIQKPGSHVVEYIKRYVLD